MEGVVERPTPAERPSKANDGSLLRLFRSSYFDPWMAFLYIYRHPQAGVVDYISNQLYNFCDADIEFYLPQLCHLLLHVLSENSSLERFLVDKCTRSAHFALKATWWLRSYLEEADPTLKKRLEVLIADCEYAAIHLKRQERNSLRTPSPQAPKTVPVKPPAPSQTSAQSVPDMSPSTHAPPHKASDTKSETDVATLVDSGADQARSELFENMAWFVNELGALSERLRRVAVPLRAQRLQEEITVLNSILFAPLGQSLSTLAAGTLQPPTPRARAISISSVPPVVLSASTSVSLAPAAVAAVATAVAVPDPIPVPVLQLPLPPLRGLYLPLWSPAQHPHTLINVVPVEAVVLNSRERVPYIVYVEVIDGSITASSAANATGNGATPHTPQPVALPTVVLQSQAEQQTDSVRVELAKLMAQVHKYETTELLVSHADEPAAPGSAVITPPDRPPSTDAGRSHSSFNSTPDDSVSAVLPFGETIEVRSDRLRKSSPYGHHPGWRLLACIVKSGDELRQEQLATQLIAIFRDIFAQNKLPLFLRPYCIIVTSTKSGLIEAIPNIVSLHQLHKMSNLTLAEYFRKSYGGDSHKYKLAQRNFSESLAGYSLLTYILQVKDRHNGNILLDNEGHIVHIDFGFMLSNSPGSLGFETAPFKLTQEFVDVMDGVSSAPFQYFRALCIRGFLELRKHHERILALTEMMCKGSKLPCFYGGQLALDALRDRFQSSLTEDEFIKHVDGLITASLDSWTTRQYDRYQYLTNSIW